MPTGGRIPRRSTGASDGERPDGFVGLSSGRPGKPSSGSNGRVVQRQGNQWRPIAPPAKPPPGKPASNTKFDHTYDEGDAFDDVSAYALDVDNESQVMPGGGVALTDEQMAKLDKFWSANGVKSATQRKNLVKTAFTRGLYRDPERLIERIVELEDSLWRAVNIQDIDMGVLVGRFPRVLYFEPDFLVEKLRLMRDLLPGVNLRRVIERNPQILSMDATCTLPAKMRELSVLLPHTDVIRLIELHPKVLSINVGGKVAENLANLKALMKTAGVVETAVELMVAYSPRLLTSDVTGTIRRRLEQIEKVSPGTFRRYSDKPATLARLLCASERTIDRIAYLRRMRSEDVVAEGVVSSEVRFGTVGSPPSVVDFEVVSGGSFGGGFGGNGGLGSTKLGERKINSEIRAVTLSAAEFSERFPDFPEWQKAYEKTRKAESAEAVRNGSDAAAKRAVEEAARYIRAAFTP